MTGFLSAQAGIHAQHVQNATSRIDPRLRGDDNNSTYLQDDAPVPIFALEEFLQLQYWVVHYYKSEGTCLE